MNKQCNTDDNYLNTEDYSLNKEQKYFELSSCIMCYHFVLFTLFSYNSVIDRNSEKNHL